MMSREWITTSGCYLGLIVVSVLLMRLLIGWSGARLRLSQLRHLHRDEQGAIQSLSFVLTLPLFVMLLLFILQLSQLTIARAVVEYAAFAAARSAVVWIPATLGDDFETENRISQRLPVGDETDAAGIHWTVYQIEPGSPKFEKIRMAAVLAVLSVCPSRDTGVAPDDRALAAAAVLERAYLAFAPTSATNPRIPQRLRNKLAYAWHCTEVDLEIRHKESEPPLVRPWPDAREFEDNEIGWQDQVLVTVRHNFALLPGPGRFLAKPTPRIAPNASAATGDRVANRLRRVDGLFVYPMSATVRLPNEGEKSVLPYVQTLTSVPAATAPALEPAPPQEDEAYWND